VKRTETLWNHRIVVSDAAIVAQLVQPRGCFVTFDPQFRIGEIAKQSPVARRPVTAPDAPPLGHGVEASFSSGRAA